MHSIKDTVKQLIGKSLDAYNKKYTSPINNRIDNIVAQAGTDNTEIVDARIDSAGVSHTTLNNRILAETKMTDEKLIEYTGSSLSVDDTMPGYLQNIEIKGNTIQNEDNLEDIRSVGDKIEGQELYEIPVLSVGKNLFDISETLSLGKLNPTRGDISLSERSDGLVKCDAGFSVNVKSQYGGVVSDFIKIKPNTTYVFSAIKNGTFAEQSTLCYYDKDKNPIGNGWEDKGWRGSFTSPNNAYYFKICWWLYNPGTISYANIQLEEGTVATTYEPYQEDKLTILSPVQLEKVGDVRDRIIEKDGVWGVEKNIYTATVDSFYQHSNKQLWYIHKDKVPSWKSKNIWNEVSNRVMCNYYKEVATYNEVSVTKGIFIDHKGATPIIIIGTNDVNVNSLPSDLIVKYQLETPQFIPLPHDQQVKLRTFANKTNISFGCEIEGTIKAQVPKSLGATVNTHTTQISNLNKELDRVKKLEESTVSTVTTESDFTTVEATSNGYFEDVKLEGKTLVSKYSAKTITKNIEALYSYVFITPFTVEVGKTYTIVGNVKSPTKNAFDLKYKESNAYMVTLRDTFAYTFTATRNEKIALVSLETGEYIITDLMILEGDHTQNPPNGYIEGLKSVGDGVDEIVVSSVGNIQTLSDYVVGFIADATGILNSGNTDFMSYNTFIKVDANTSYWFKYGVEKVYCYREDKSYIGVIGTSSVFLNSFTTPLDCAYVKYRYNKTLGNIPKLNYIVGGKYQSDKKRLLFYNEETQTWEKPILREWDSIEKHSNGKYYYHQRSGEVVLNGSEDWVKTSSPNTTVIRYRMNLVDKPINTDKDNTLCNILPCKTFNALYQGDNIGVCVYTSSTSSADNYVYINSEISELAGFKQWLQANNVTVAYQLAEEKVYECTNIDLITCANETNYMVESGVIVPRTTLKVHNNISNVVSLLQKKVSLLESNMTKYMVTQNRMQLASTYSADSVTFKVDYFSLCDDEENYDEDLYNLILNNILVGKDNYNYDKMFTMILDYASWNQISWEQFDILVGLMDMQHNPPVEEEITEDESIEETPVE